MASARGLRPLAAAAPAVGDDPAAWSLLERPVSWGAFVALALLALVPALPLGDRAGSRSASGPRSRRSSSRSRPGPIVRSSTRGPRFTTRPRCGAFRPARLPDAPRAGRVHRFRAGSRGSPRCRGPQADDPRGGGRRRRRVPGDAPRGRVRRFASGCSRSAASSGRSSCSARAGSVAPCPVSLSRRSSSRRRPPLRPEASPREARTSTGVAGIRSRVAEAEATSASCGTRTTPASRFPRGRRSSSGSARRSEPSTGARRRSTRSLPIAGSRTSTRWTPAPPAAGCRPIRSSPTATASRAAGSTSR